MSVVHQTHPSRTDPRVVFDTATIVAVTAVACGLAHAHVLASTLGVAPLTVTTASFAALAASATIAARTRRAHGPLTAWHHVTLIVACAAMAALVTGDMSLVDVMGPAIATMLAVGRVGCHLGGCCHGRPTRTGWAMPAAVIRWSSAPYVGVRLAPVALGEALGNTCVAVLATYAALTAHAGVGLGVALAGTAVVRLLGETWRGDPARGGSAVATTATRSAVLAGFAATAWLWVVAGGPVVAISLIVVAGALATQWLIRGWSLTADDHLAAASAARRTTSIPSRPELSRADQRRLERTKLLTIQAGQRTGTT